MSSDPPPTLPSTAAKMQAGSSYFLDPHPARRGVRLLPGPTTHHKCRPDPQVGRFQLLPGPTSYQAGRFRRNRTHHQPSKPHNLRETDCSTAQRASTIRKELHDTRPLNLEPVRRQAPQPI